MVEKKTYKLQKKSEIIWILILIFAKISLLLNETVWNVDVATLFEFNYNWEYFFSRFSGKPDSLTNCTVLNQTYNGFQIECIEGFDGSYSPHKQYNADLIHIYRFFLCLHRIHYSLSSNWPWTLIFTECASLYSLFVRTKFPITLTKRKLLE